MISRVIRLRSRHDLLYLVHVAKILFFFSIHRKPQARRNPEPAAPVPLRGKAKQECLPQNSTPILCAERGSLCGCCPGPSDPPTATRGRGAHMIGRKPLSQKGIPFFVYSCYFRGNSGTVKLNIFFILHSQKAASAAKPRTRRACTSAGARQSRNACRKPPPQYYVQNVARSAGAARAPATRLWPRVAMVLTRSVASP